MNVAIRYVWYDMQIKQYFREIKIFELTLEITSSNVFIGFKDLVESGLSGGILSSGDN